MKPAAESAATASLSEPLRASMTCKEGLDAYLEENGFTVEGYESKWTPASAFGIRFSVPNTRFHRWAIMRHDLHHVATGYGTDLVGEAEVSAWEASHGLRGLGLYVGSIVFTGVAAGVLLAPRRTYAAWRSAPGSGSLFQSKRRYEELLAMTVGELRAELGLPAQGVAHRPRGLHGLAPAAQRSMFNRVTA